MLKSAFCHLRCSILRGGRIIRYTEGSVCRSICLAQQGMCLVSRKTDILLPDKGSGHTKFYPQGVADVLKGEWILYESDDTRLLQLYMYEVECVDLRSSKAPFLNQVSQFAVLIGTKLNAEVLSMSINLYVTGAILVEASLVYKGSITINKSQLVSLKDFHVRLLRNVLDVDHSTTLWDSAKAYIFVPLAGKKSIDPANEIDWELVQSIVETETWVNPLPGSLIRGAYRLPSVMSRVENMLLAIQLKGLINYPIPSLKVLEALTAASCKEPFCYERAEFLGDAYLKWVVSLFLFLKYPQKHEGQLIWMRQNMVSNLVLYQHALDKGLQSYIQVDRFAPSRWAAPGVLPVSEQDTQEGDSSLFEQEKSLGDDRKPRKGQNNGNDESDLSSYRVLSSKTLADVVEALIGVYYVEGGKHAANHFMKWIGILESDPKEDCMLIPSNIPESIFRGIDFEALEGTLGIKFKNRGFFIEAITPASQPSSAVSGYQRLKFVGAAVLDHLITNYLFFTYTDLPPGRLTDLRAAIVNNANLARVVVNHKLHLHVRHGSSALEPQIQEFVKEVKPEFSKPGFNSFGLGDIKAPKVLADIFKRIVGAIFLDNGQDTDVVWTVFQPLLQPMVTPETLGMHPVRELQELCHQQGDRLNYKVSHCDTLVVVEVFINGVQIEVAKNPHKKIAKKLAAKAALMILKNKDALR